MAVSKKSLKNLIYVKKGSKCLNPKGRPKKIPNLRILLANVLGEDSNGNSDAEAILKALSAKAKRGDVRAAELLLDRTFGKVAQSLEIEAKVEENLNIATLSYEQLLKLRNAKDESTSE